MSSSIKKPLYITNTFAELIDKTDVPALSRNCDAKKYVNYFHLIVNTKLGKFLFSRLCKSAMELYRSAQESFRGGDEEMAFIFFMRYCHIIKSLQKRGDYRSKEAELKPLFGGNEYLCNALDTAEVLRASLIERFNERNNSSKAYSIHITPSPSIMKRNDSNNKSKSPLPKEIDSQQAYDSEYISAKELYTLIQNGNNGLIMDCRPQKDYQESRLKYEHCVNVPEDVIAEG